MTNEPMIHEIDLKEDAVYIVSRGSVTILEPMEHGTDQITWNKNNSFEVVRSHRIRTNGVVKINGNLVERA